VIAARRRRSDRRLFAVSYINRPFAWKGSFSTAASALTGGSRQHGKMPAMEGYSRRHATAIIAATISANCRLPISRLAGNVRLSGRSW
jgi:hypothetical protein